MKILYIAVHSHMGWGAEYWIARAFEEMKHEVIRYDYRKRRKYGFPWRLIQHELSQIVKKENPHIAFIQRGEKMPSSIPAALKLPVVYWSTEPIQLKRDADKLLSYEYFSKVFVHSYSCYELVKKRFAHLLPCCTVMHNACPESIIEVPKQRNRFALFNRTLSKRRREWLSPSADMAEFISGRFGEEYFRDLAESEIALNVHFSEENLDDFESGIFEAMAKGCVVVTEKLNNKTITDLGMSDAFIEVDSPFQMRETLLRLKENPEELEKYRNRAYQAILGNTWKNRATQIISSFEEILGYRTAP